MNRIIIQNVFFPFFVFSEELSLLRVYERFQDLTLILNDIEIEEKTKILVNRGPGSYSGIRTALSYVLGLEHGKAVSPENIFSFTSFDFVLSEFPVYYASWPRNEAVSFEETRGYLQKTPSEQIIYVNGTEAKKLPSVTIVSEKDIISDQIDYILFEKLVTPEHIQKFLKVTEFSKDRTPLYINPVHITT